MGKISQPVFRLESGVIVKGKNRRKQNVFTFKKWKPLPGQLKFRELYPYAEQSCEVQLGRKRKKIQG